MRFMWQQTRRVGTCGRHGSAIGCQISTEDTRSIILPTFKGPRKVYLSYLKIGGLQIKAANDENFGSIKNDLSLSPALAHWHFRYFHQCFYKFRCFHIDAEYGYRIPEELKETCNKFPTTLLSSRTVLTCQPSPRPRPARGRARAAIAK